jgi:hypothetical protein
LNPLRESRRAINLKHVQEEQLLTVE